MTQKMTGDQITELAQQLNDALRNRVPQMLADENSLDTQLASITLTYVQTMATISAFNGQPMDAMTMMAVMFVLGKIAERDGWGLG